MAGPEVGAAPCRCAECGGYAYGGAPVCRTCRDCGERLGRGPLGCPACDRAHGFRYAAIETDRPGVPAGNEHAVRVNVSVVRRPCVTSADELEVRSRLLPVLLAGLLPTNHDAQRMGALIRNSAPERRPELIERAVENLFRRAGRTPGWTPGPAGS